MYDIAIICGGKASRLGDIAKNTPKSLMDINGKPFIYHQLKLLESNGFDHVVLCLWNMGDQIESYVKTLHMNIKIDFSYDGNGMLGTGGSVKNAFKYLDNAFFVLYGDSYLPVNYLGIENYYKTQCNDMALMTVYRNTNPIHINNAIVKNNKVTFYSKLVTTPHMKHIDYGIGILQKKHFDLAKEYNFGLNDIYYSLAINKQLCALETRKKFYEIGSLDGIEELKKYLEEENG